MSEQIRRKPGIFKSLFLVSLALVSAAASAETLERLRAMYPCADRLFTATPLFGFSNPRPSLFFTRDLNKRRLEIVTPFFAGWSEYYTDKNGRPTVLMVERGSTGVKHPRYNIRLPYQPLNGPGQPGFFYLTAEGEDQGLPPRFLPGKGEAFPHFSRFNPEGPIQITSYSSEKMEFYSLPVEDRLWNADSGHATADSNVVHNFLRDIEYRINVLGDGTVLGTSADMLLDPSRPDNAYGEILAICRDAAEMAGFPAIVEAVNLQRQQPLPYIEQRNTQIRWEQRQAEDDIIATVEKGTEGRAWDDLYGPLISYKESIHACGVVKNAPPLPGNFRVQFAISPTGDVENANVVYAGDWMAPYLDCLSAKLQRVRFPAIAFSETVRVRCNYRIVGSLEKQREELKRK